MQHSPNTFFTHGSITPSMRASFLGQRPHLFWFTGLSGAGKSTLADALQERLFDEGHLSFTFDGDNVRHGLCRDLGFSPEDRAENIRRIGEMCRLFLDAGVICMAAFISPMASIRATVRAIVGRERFSEIYIACPLDVCEARDVKGNYKKARAGLIPNYTGVSAPYEEPTQPDVRLDTATHSVEDCVEKLLAYVRTRICL